jgi:hypothetical protein
MSSTSPCHEFLDGDRPRHAMIASVGKYPQNEEYKQIRHAVQQPHLGR